MRFIELSQGKRAIVNSADYPKLNRISWHYSNGYAAHTYKVDGETHAITMQSFLMGTPVGMETDHRNGDKLDNRRRNLRIASSAQNKWNMPRVGITYRKDIGKWYSRIRVNGRRIHIGYFSTKESAMAAYRKAELNYHGDFARVGV